MEQAYAHFSMEVGFGSIKALFAKIPVFPAPLGSTCSSALEIYMIRDRGFAVCLIFSISSPFCFGHQAGRANSFLSTESPNQAIPQDQHDTNNNTGKFEYGDPVTLLRHASHAARRTFDGGAHGGEDVVGAVDDFLRACIIVDVHGHTAQCRDFGGQLVETRAVLPAFDFHISTAYM